jgi:hypothetical protein
MGAYVVLMIALLHPLKTRRRGPSVTKSPASGESTLGTTVRMVPPSPPDPEVVSDARKLHSAGANIETILVFLRERGFNKIDSIKTVRPLYGLSMEEAKDFIDHSDAWSDRFYSDMQFRETAIRALRDIAAENANDPNRLKITLGPDEPED